MNASAVALTISRGRVMRGEEHGEQVFVGDHARIKVHLDHFRVPRLSGAYGFIRRLHGLPARVSRHDAFHATQHVEHGFRTPEAPASEHGRICFHRCHHRLPTPTEPCPLVKKEKMRYSPCASSCKLRAKRATMVAMV